MFTYALIAVLAALVIYLIIDNFTLTGKLKNADNQIIAFNAWGDQIESERDSYYDYAIALHIELNDLERKYGRVITSWKIDQKLIPATKIAYTVGNNGNSKQESIVALELFDQSPYFKGEYSASFTDPIYENGMIKDHGGLITYAPIVKVEPTPKAKDNGKAKETVKETPAQSNETESELFESAKYNAFIGALVKANNKALTKDQTDYAKMKFEYWETGKNPSSTDEYVKRVIDNKFGAKK